VAVLRTLGFESKNVQRGLSVFDSFVPS
jgi:hypothetical protein